jgi:hypothetical protein
MIREVGVKAVGFEGPNFHTSYRLINIIMDPQKAKTYFNTLAVLAGFLLWGISLLNGTVKALLLAVWHGELTKDVPLKTDYTGFPPLDYPIAVLVAFFYYGTNGSHEAYQLFLVDAYSTLQSAFVWLYIEMGRPGDKSKWIHRYRTRDPFLPETRTNLCSQTCRIWIALAMLRSGHITSTLLRAARAMDSRPRPECYVPGSAYRQGHPIQLPARCDRPGRGRHGTHLARAGE